MPDDASDYLTSYLREACASLALLRAIECRRISQFALKPPVLDLGCGDGLTAAALSLAGRERMAVGLDHSASALRAAQRSGAHGLLVQGDITSLPVHESSVSTVVSNCVLEHIPDLGGALAEVRRVLRPGGKLIFTVPTAEAAGELSGAALLRKLGLEYWAQRYAQHYDDRVGHVHLYDAVTWRSLLASHGLAVVSCEAYASPKALRLHDLTAPLGIASILWKRLTGRRIICGAVRRRIGAPLMARWLRPIYEQDGPEGRSLVIVAQKLALSGQL